jgi:hypothetical protein
LYECIESPTIFDEVSPHWVLSEYSGVADDDQPIPGSCQSDIHSPHVLQESDCALVVGPDAAEYDEILLSTLEYVDSIDLYVAQEVFVSSAELWQ